MGVHLRLRATVSPLDLLVAYGLANILAAIPITPGGLGVVEGILSPPWWASTYRRDIALLAVISWRLVNFWLPIPVGGAAYVSLRFGPGPASGGGPSTADRGRPAVPETPARPGSSEPAVPARPSRWPAAPRAGAGPARWPAPSGAPAS